MSDNLYNRTYKDALTGYTNQPVVFTTKPNTTRDALDEACDRIMAKVRELGLSFQLDEKTPGDGSCFFWSVLQQLRRKEIYPTLRPDLRKLVDNNNALELRRAVCRFSLSSPLVQEKRVYLEAANNNVPWERYWSTMLTPDKWADGAVLRTTALFLGMNIRFVETFYSEKDFPFYSMLTTFDESCEEATPDIYIGSDHHFHFQSILPLSEVRGPRSEWLRESPGVFP